MTSERLDCFVISPIGSAGSDTRERADQVLEYIIREALESDGYVVERADTISESGIITSQIIQRITSADLVIADLSGLNPNVFYELAIRHMVAKPFIHLIEDGQNLPFDVSASRTIFYSLDLAGARKAVTELKRQACACREQRERIESPISIAVDLSSLSQSANPTDTAIVRIENELTKIRALVEDLGDVNSMASDYLQKVKDRVAIDGRILGSGPIDFRVGA